MGRVRYLMGFSLVTAQSICYGGVENLFAW